MRWIRAIPRGPYTGAVPDETGSPVVPTDDSVMHALRMDHMDRSTVDVVPVVYVGGSQRSGSTLLDRMLGQVSGHESAGEIVHLWARGLKNN
jgi:hypothetical protein